jgi:hypothetical protein
MGICSRRCVSAVSVAFATRLRHKWHIETGLRRSRSCARATGTQQLQARCAPLDAFPTRRRAGAATEAAQWAADEILPVMVPAGAALKRKRHGRCVRPCRGQLRLLRPRLAALHHQARGRMQFQVNSRVGFQNPTKAPMLTVLAVSLPPFCAWARTLLYSASSVRALVTE